MRYESEQVLCGGQMELGVPVYETWRVVDTENGAAPMTCGGERSRDLIEKWCRDLNERAGR